MLYADNIYSSESFKEHEIHCEYDTIVSKRARKKKPTSLQISKQNHWNKVKKCRRTIQQNFKPGDLWCTFAYKKGIRKSMREFLLDMTKFQNHLRVEYRKRGLEFKWIRRLEIGKRGGLHAHFVINTPGDTQIISEIWKKVVKDSGRVYFTDIDDEDGYNGLAEYICKEPDEEIQGQMSFIIEKKKLCSVSTSRNLKRPEPVKEKISPWKVMKIMLGREALKPSEGFCIEKDTVQTGFNKFTHMPYIRYREKKIAQSCDYKPQKCEYLAETQIIHPKTQIKTQIKKAGDEIINKAKGLFRSLKDKWKR